MNHRAPAADAGTPLGWFRASSSLPELLRLHAGTLPARAIVQIWSNMMLVSGRLNTLHVFAGQNPTGFWDLARVHFGCATPVTSHASAASVVHACAGDEGAVGIVPVPDSEETGQVWWEQLAATGRAGTRIAQGLPFVREDGCAPPLPRGYAIASIAQDETGKDATILRLECESDLSRTRLQSLLKQTGFEAQILSAIRANGTGVPSRMLVACTGHVTADDERIATMTESAGDAIASVAIVGGIANSWDTPAVSIA